MAVWRRKALELFPELRRDLNSNKYEPWNLFVELLPRVLAAHEESDEETLRRIYSFAEWCLRQNARQLYNSAGVTFYERIFDPNTPRRDWDNIVSWLSPEVVQDVWGLWEWRLPPGDLSELRKLLVERGHSIPSPAQSAPATATHRQSSRKERRSWRPVPRG